jgi:putative transposase
VEEALVEMYLAGVSVRRVEDITEALWGTRVSPSTVSELNQKIYAQIETWRNRPIEGKHPGRVVAEAELGGEVRNVSLLVAIGVNGRGISGSAGSDGRVEGRQGELDSIPAASERARAARRAAVCLRQVFGAGGEPGRVLSGSAVAAVRGAFLSECVDGMPTSKVKEVAAMLKAIHAQEDRAAARQKAEQVAAKLKEMKLVDAAEHVRAGIEETLYYYTFPREHWRSLRMNNPLERLLREVRRRTRALGAFPDGKSALMLAAARLRHVAGTNWGMRLVSGHEPPVGSERSGMNAHAKTFHQALCLNKCAKNSGHYHPRSLSGVGISRHLTNNPNFQRQELRDQLDCLMLGNRANRTTGLLTGYSDGQTAAPSKTKRPP